MECNVGKTEQVVRVIIALVAAWLGYKYSAWWYVLTAVGILTAAMRFCPLTHLLGINTCKN
ncbi:DUF2892 domain-containing protein [Candidatus Pacearchaeota archaeon]|nr:MAG: DUF2892 domain-containing protein [Candidatus Pacearchaeota archaeon]